MLKKNPGHHQNSLFSSLSDQSDQRHALYRLVDKINWDIFEQAFSSLYCSDNGRLVKPVRLMYGLLILKYLRNISDGSVVEQWSENDYYQYFCPLRYVDSSVILPILIWATYNSSGKGRYLFDVLQISYF